MKSEIEAKLKVSSHDQVKEKLSSLAAQFIEDQKQTDIYFDNPGSLMVRQDKCLRIRKQQTNNSQKTLVTYKGPKVKSQIKSRPEAEFEVSDPHATEQMFLALGYNPVLTVEKNRSLWKLDNCTVALDDVTDLGTYVEIEGPDETQIADVQQKLDLADLPHIPESYACLLDRKAGRINKNISAMQRIDIDPKNGYIALIVNPNAGASSQKLMLTNFVSYLASRKFDVRKDFTESLQHANELAANAAADPACQIVVAVGGDGLVREVMHSIERSGKPILVIPAGTENILANELGFDEKLSTLINTFNQGYTRNLDLGHANGKCFTSIAGFGFDAQIVKEVSSHRTGHIDHFDYFWPIWKTFWKYKFPPMVVEVDGQEVFNGKGLVFVGNISRYALGLQILRHANYSDGLLDLCIYKCSNHFQLAWHSIMTIIKRHSSPGKKTIYRQGCNFKISSPSNNVAIEIDGDPGPSLPIEINVIPNAIKVIVPQNAKPAGLRTRIIRALG